MVLSLGRREEQVGGGLIPPGVWVRVEAGLWPVLPRPFPDQPQPGLKGQTDNKSFPPLAPRGRGFLTGN